MDSNVEALLRALLRALNQKPRFKCAGPDGKPSDSYALAAAIERALAMPGMTTTGAKD